VKLADTNNKIYTITTTEVSSGRYDDTTDDKNYYIKSSVGATNDSYEGDNFLFAKEGEMLFKAKTVKGYYKESEVTFTLQKSGTYSAGDYYEKVGNRYKKATIEIGKSLVGYYTVSFGTAEGDNAVYDGSSYYYEKIGDMIIPVGGLTLGTNLAGFYTVAATEVSNDTKADGTTKYYITNTRGDYVCIGTPPKDTVLSDYLCWARTYSNHYASHNEGDNALKVIKDNVLNSATGNSYYYKDTFYIRTVADTDTAKNLRVEEVTIKGDDSLTSSLRVLFVATNGEGEVARADYSERDKKITHWNTKNLFDMVHGDSEEVIKIDVYIYYDGTDDTVKTQGIKISGQEIEIKFEVDKQEYEV
jgi:hypothetical protein